MEMQTLEQLRKKYPRVKFKYEPYSECPRCRGEGEYRSKAGRMNFCFCTFVEHDREFLQITHEIFNEMGRKGDIDGGHSRCQKL
jgi:hypothetical protein